MTEALREVDEIRAPPVAPAPQLRGWAEPYSLDMDFGTIDPSRPWALIMTGWLHFGGGMANIGASHDASLPFPFPTLEIMGPDGNWEPLEVVTGAPAGKTKTMIVDLADRLPYERAASVAVWPLKSIGTAFNSWRRWVSKHSGPCREPSD